MKNYIKAFILLITILFYSSNSFADCTCTIKVKIKDNSKGNVTITKIKTASVTRVSAFYVVSTYATKWSGTRKINVGETKTFNFRVNSGCPISGSTQLDGHRFRVFRLDGKKCSRTYGGSSKLDQCTPGNSDPVVSCGPNNWK